MGNGIVHQAKVVDWQTEEIKRHVGSETFRTVESGLMHMRQLSSLQIAAKMKMAIENRSLLATKWLLDHKAAPTTTDLARAARFKTLSIVQLFLERGVPITHGAALWAAVRHRSYACLDLLIDRKANVDAFGMFAYNSALAAAVENKDTRCVKKLLEAKANPRSIMSNGSTTLEYAELQRQRWPETWKTIADLLQFAACKPAPPAPPAPAPVMMGSPTASNVRALSLRALCS